MTLRKSEIRRRKKRRAEVIKLTDQQYCDKIPRLREWNDTINPTCLFSIWGIQWERCIRIHEMGLKQHGPFPEKEPNNFNCRTPVDDAVWLTGEMQA